MMKKKIILHAQMFSASLPTGNPLDQFGVGIKFRYRGLKCTRGKI